MRVIRQNIDDMPTIDAVPVVRCRDCKYGMPDEDACDYKLEITCVRDIVWEAHDPDWYCPRGERGDLLDWYEG